jgi:hypothetical protein
MNSLYEGVGVDEIESNPFEIADERYEFRPLGTFAGTIYKSLYRSNGKLVPSDTSDQLISDGPKAR